MSAHHTWLGCSISFEAVDEDDSGWYQCLVRGPGGSTLSQAAHLQVVAEGAMPAAEPAGLLALAAFLAVGIVVVQRPTARRRGGH